MVLKTLRVMRVARRVCLSGARGPATVLYCWHGKEARAAEADDMDRLQDCRQAGTAWHGRSSGRGQSNSEGGRRVQATSDEALCGAAMTPILRRRQDGSAPPGLFVSPHRFPKMRIATPKTRHFKAFLLPKASSRFRKLTSSRPTMQGRFSDTTLVSPSRTPRDGVFERRENYYVYLKPCNWRR
jgi:hypothetical protein